MAEVPLYIHHQSGRRPLTLLAGVGWLLITDPQSGALLTPRVLRFTHGRQGRTIALAEIASVRKHIWSEGPDEIILILNDGEEVTISSQSIDRGFVAALEAAGVRRSQD